MTSNAQWVFQVAGFPGAAFRVRPIATADLMELIAARQQAIPQSELMTLTAAGYRRAMARAKAAALLDAVLVEWQGVKVRGADVPFADALEVLSRNSSLCAAVIRAALVAGLPDARGRCQIAAGRA